MLNCDKQYFAVDFVVVLDGGWGGVGVESDEVNEGSVNMYVTRTQSYFLLQTNKKGPAIESDLIVEEEKKK